MAPLDLLVNDFLDIPVPASDYVADGRLRIDALLSAPAMRSSLAFQAAWSSAVGLRPSRADFSAFATRVPGGAIGAATWSAGVSGALVAELCCTSVRMLQEQVAKQVLERAAATYEGTLAELSRDTEGHRTAHALAAKLADRFGAVQPPQPVNPASLPAAYAEMVVSDPSLARLERWAYTDATRRAVASVADYYDRVSAAAAVLGLPGRSPMTSFEVTGAPRAGDTPMSPLELLRYAIVRDMYLWRQDVGGSILLCGGSASAALEISRGKDPEPFRIRTLSGPCVALVLPSLPPAYMRVVADVSDGDDARAVELHLGRVADVVPLAPAVDVDLDLAVRSGRGSQKRTRRLVTSRDWPQSAEPQPATYWIPTHDALFGASQVPPKWAAAAASSALRAHLLHACPISGQQGGVNGMLLMNDFVLRYASARRLGERVFVTAPPGKAGRTGEVVVIDNRRNVWSVLSVLVTLDNLRAADWSVRFLCGSGNREWIAERLLPHAPHACVEVMSDLDTGALFSIEDYNVLLKSPELWRRLSASQRVLTVQDDGMLVLPGLDGPEYDDVRAQAFVGAPWALEPEIYRNIMRDSGVPDAFVGNGGLSLRDPAIMLEICEAEADGLARALFNNNSQPMPEDVFFAVALDRRGIGASRALAKRFAFEADVPKASDELPLGFHKPWPYAPAADVAAAFERLLQVRLAIA